MQFIPYLNCWLFGLMLGLCLAVHFARKAQRYDRLADVAIEYLKMLNERCELYRRDIERQMEEFNSKGAVKQDIAASEETEIPHIAEKLENQNEA